LTVDNEKLSQVMTLI